jgi:multiple antibiotic resistance protein
MLDFIATTIVSILFVVDPLGAVPMYLAMVQSDSAPRRRRTAIKATLTATATLVAFAAAGDVIFHLFGFTMSAFRIAGGAILFLVALDMIRAQRPTQESPDEVNEGLEKDDVAVTPLGVPMLAGPAALSTVAVLMSRTTTWTHALIVYGAIILTGAVTYLTLRSAEPLYRGLGKTGIHVFSRVLGLILASIAVQFILDGLRAADLLQAVR